MISDEERREVAQELRHYAAYGEGAMVPAQWVLHILGMKEAQ